MSLKQFAGHMKGISTLGVPSGTCEECATKHEPDQPHNQQSLVYQYNFYDKEGRWPKWKDAMEHCTQEVKDKWIALLKEKGVTEFL